MTELRILSGGAAEGLVGRTAPAFETETGFHVAGTFGAVGVMAAKLRQGEAADILILTRALIDELAGEGRVDAASAVDLGAVPTSVAVRNGDPVPEVSTGDKLRAALLAAPALFSADIETATAGRHVAWTLKELGIWDEMSPKLKVYPNGATAMAALAASGIPGAIGSTQATEILNTAGITLIADLPEGVSLLTIYTAAVAMGSAHAPEAKRLISLLAANPARADLGFAG
ncbi:substrate-binding domain-containing protein [Aquabacter sp. CN5-332]|uniref:molybdate ABC transporter substrate-binding protein n=1 Tax=Aquabacter sp. CN5-332 TaxID=3156608 RepID=UPI0032B3B137